MAAPIDDNAADEKSDKSIQQLLNIRCTSVPTSFLFYHLVRQLFFVCLSGVFSIEIL